MLTGSCLCKGVAYEVDAELKEVIDLVASGFFSPDDRGLFQPLLDSLLGRDEYLVMTDFAAYSECQRQVTAAFRDRETWTRKAALNVARLGGFSAAAKADSPERSARFFAPEPCFSLRTIESLSSSQSP